MPSANETLVNDLYAAAGGGDWDKVETLITPDFKFIESDAFPVGGTYSGIREYRALFESVMETAGEIDFTFVGMTSSDDYVVALMELHFKDHGIRAPLAESFRIRDGRVCEIIPYYLNPHLAAKAFAKAPARIREKLGR